VRDVPNNWQDGVSTALRASDPDIRLAAIQAAEGLSLQELAADLHRAAADAESNATLRLIALRALAVLQEELSDQEFDHLLSSLSPEVPMQERLTALDVLAHARHSDTRLRKLVPLIQSTSPIELPAFLSAFSQGTDAGLGRELVDALMSSSVNPVPELVEQALKNYGATVTTAAGPLMDRLNKAVQDQVARLNELEGILETRPGNAERGRELFFGKAQCHLCHTVAGRGGKVGPDLSTIGEIRSRRDLLESVVFPSASFARGFESMSVALDDGRVLTGLAGRETADELVLMVVQDNKLVEVPIRRGAIEQVRVGRVSTMPNGLDQQLQPQELSDLIVHLQQLRKISKE
jgi:putative heme-binding domain-containing protein